MKRQPTLQFHLRFAGCYLRPCWYGRAGVDNPWFQPLVSIFLANMGGFRLGWVKGREGNSAPVGLAEVFHCTPQGVIHFWKFLNDKPTRRTSCVRGCYVQMEILIPPKGWKGWKVPRGEGTWNVPVSFEWLLTLHFIHVTHVCKVFGFRTTYDTPTRYFLYQLFGYIFP